MADLIALLKDVPQDAHVFAFVEETWPDRNCPVTNVKSEPDKIVLEIDTNYPVE